MENVRNKLVKYGAKIAGAKLVAGAGGNISARDGKIVWMKPSGLTMEEIKPADLCGMDLETGRQIHGERRPTSEVNMHLAVYRIRPEVKAVFHTHSPWAAGVISARTKLLERILSGLRPGVGRVTTIPYVTPTTQRLADAMGAAVKRHDTVLMVNHGVLAVGTSMAQAFSRCRRAEEAALAAIKTRAGSSSTGLRGAVQQIRSRTTRGSKGTR